MSKDTYVQHFDVSDGTQTDVAYNILKVMAYSIYIKSITNMKVILQSYGFKYTIIIPNIYKHSIEKQIKLKHVLEDIKNYEKGTLDEDKEIIIDEIKENLEENPEVMSDSFSEYEINKYIDYFNYANEYEGL